MRELKKTEKAVIDRIVDGKTAVILVGNKEYNYPASKLPKGAQEGVWVFITINEGRIIAVSVDQKETEEVRRRIRSKMDKLRKRGHKN